MEVGYSGLVIAHGYPKQKVPFIKREKLYLPNTKGWTRTKVFSGTLFYDLQDQQLYSFESKWEKFDKEEVTFLDIFEQNVYQIVKGKRIVLTSLDSTTVTTAFGYAVKEITLTVPYGLKVCRVYSDNLPGTIRFFNDYTLIVTFNTALTSDLTFDYTLELSNCTKIPIQQTITIPNYQYTGSALIDPCESSFTVQLPALPITPSRVTSCSSGYTAILNANKTVTLSGPPIGSTTTLCYQVYDAVGNYVVVNQTILVNDSPVTQSTVITSGTNPITVNFPLSYTPDLTTTVILCPGSSLPSGASISYTAPNTFFTITSLSPITSSFSFCYVLTTDGCSVQVVETVNIIPVPSAVFTQEIESVCVPTYALRPGVPPVSSANVVVEVPGTGAFTTQIPTPGSAVGGNCRGPNSVDFQKVRSASTQVAGGDTGFIAASTSSKLDSFTTRSAILASSGTAITGPVTDSIGLYGSGNFITATPGFPITSAVIGGDDNRIQSGVRPVPDATILGVANATILDSEGAAIVGGFDGTRTISGGVGSGHSGAIMLGGCSPGGTWEIIGAAGSLGASMIGGDIFNRTINSNTPGASIIGGYANSQTINSNTPGASIIGGYVVTQTIDSGAPGASIIGGYANSQTIYSGAPGASIIGGDVVTQTIDSGAPGASIIGGYVDTQIIGSNAYGASIIGGGNPSGFGTSTIHANSIASTILGGDSATVGTSLASCSYAVTLGGQGLSVTTDTSVAMGAYNLTGSLNSSNRVFMIGGGSTITPSNIFSVTQNGDVYATGTITPSTTADFAEMFESFDGSKIPIGTVVTTVPDTDKIRPATAGDPILGVISNTAAMLCGGAGEEYAHKYLLNENGDYIYEDVPVEYQVVDREKRKEHEEEKGKEDKGKEEEHEERKEKKSKYPTKTVIKMERRRKLHPAYDSTKPYVPRVERKEWNPVGIVGKVKILNGQPLKPDWIKLNKFNDKLTWYLIR